MSTEKTHGNKSSDKLRKKDPKESQKSKEKIQADLVAESNGYTHTRTLTDEEKKLIDGMRYKLSSSEHDQNKYKGDDVGELLRFLKARENDLDKAWDMYSTHLKWREEFKPHEIEPDSIKEEMKTRKLRILPADKDGHMSIVFCAGKHFPGVRPMEDTLRYLVLIANQAIKQLPPGQEKVNIIYDRRGFTRKNFDRSLISAIAHLLEANFPERVGWILIYQTDWLFSLLYKIVKPFLPAETVKKIRVLDTGKLKEEMLTFYEEESLWHRHGGTWHDKEENTSEEGAEEKEEKKTSSQSEEEEFASAES